MPSKAESKYEKVFADSPFEYVGDPSNTTNKVEHSVQFKHCTFTYGEQPGFRKSETKQPYYYEDCTFDYAQKPSSNYNAFERSPAPEPAYNYPETIMDRRTSTPLRRPSDFSEHDDGIRRFVNERGLHPKPNAPLITDEDIRRFVNKRGLHPKPNSPPADDDDDEIRRFVRERGLTSKRPASDLDRDWPSYGAPYGSQRDDSSDKVFRPRIGEDEDEFLDGMHKHQSHSTTEADSFSKWWKDEGRVAPNDFETSEDYARRRRRDFPDMSVEEAEDRWITQHPPSRFEL